MPIYEYQCVDCSARERRIAALDDHTALCVACGGLMLRLDGDAFQAYFEVVPPPGCDGLCRIDCEAHDPKDAYCREQEAEEWP